MNRLSLGALAVLSGCAGARSSQVGPETFAISCKRSRANCYEEAGRVCPAGFELVDGGEQQGAMVFASEQSAYVVPTYRGDMLVRCRGRVAAAPELEPTQCSLQGSDCGAVPCCDGRACVEGVCR